MPGLTLFTSEFPPFRGGIGAVAYALANTAAEQGESVVAYAPDYRDVASGREDENLSFEVRRYRAGPYSGGQMPRYLKVALTAARYPDSNDLIAIDAPFIEALALTRHLHGRPFDAILHGSEILRAKHTLKGRLLGAKRIFGTPARLYANSAFTRDLALENMPFLSPDRVTVAPLGVDETWFRQADPARIRRKLGVGDRRLIVATGRITQRKGQHDLLKAFTEAALPTEVADRLAIVIAGRATGPDASYAESVRETASRFASLPVLLRDNLNNTDLRDLYGAADLFCLPGSARSRAVEGFGLVFLEAAAQGLPALAGRVGGVPEAVLDGETGVLVEPDNPPALGRALAKLLTNEPLRVSLGKAARAHARRHSWATFTRIVRKRA